jgi:hypothetical protein
MMKNKKFVKVFETYLQRYTRGGFLTGDMVKIKDAILRSDFFKKQTQGYQLKLKDWMNSDLLIRVSSVKPIRPTTQGSSNSEITGSEFDVDVTQEIAPGRYVDYVTIPAEFLEPYDNGANLPPIPASLKHKGKVQIKPEQEETADKPQVASTNLSDDGKGKLTKGERKLLNKNIKIPARPAEGEKSPAVKSYTHKYLPKS